MENFYRDQLIEKGLKVTPQRLAVFEAVVTLKNHPTAELVINYIKKNHPSISVGTVYKVLDSLVAHNLVKRVKTEKDVMRYDAVLSSHHHLYCSDTERIEDYEDEELNQMILDHFRKKKIRNFTIQDIRLQITGKFNSKK